MGIIAGIRGVIKMKEKKGVINLQAMASLQIIASRLGCRLAELLPAIAGSKPPVLGGVIGRAF